MAPLDTGQVSPVAAGLDLSALGAHLLAEFPTRRFAAPRVVWLNSRWFLRLGLAIELPEVREAVERDLLQRCAFTSRSPHDVDTDFQLGDGPLAFADRYGQTAGGINGGSGRCAIVDNFIVKGVGRTPLVSDMAEWRYAHGQMWLEEAIHEAIAAEITYAEMPHRSAPAVAIIDTGILGHDEDGGRTARRALLVRPNFVRLGHLQRSIYFGQGGAADSEQYLDALRTREALQAVWGPKARRADLGVECDSLEETTTRLVDQLTFAQAHRLWPGEMSSSNLSIDGRFVDHGAFKPLRDWSRYQPLSHMPPFGGEITSLGVIAHSLARLCAKHDLNQASFERLRVLIGARAPVAFRKAVRQGLGLNADGEGDGADELVAAFQAFFTEQQKKISRWPMRTRPGWALAAWMNLHRDRQRGRTDAESQAFARQVHDRLTELRPETVSDGLDHSGLRAAIARFLTPRPFLYWEVVRRRAKGLVRRLPLDEDPVQARVRIATFIDDLVTVSRRHWPDLPHTHAVLGQASCPHASLLYCYDTQRGRRVIWAQLLRRGDQSYFFDVPARIELPAESIKVADDHVVLCHPVETSVEDAVREIWGPGAQVPKLRAVFDLEGLLPPEFEQARA